MIVVAVVGRKSSGKTTVVEALVHGLTKKGYSVATAKHVPEHEFTIDIKGKDTWRHARAGARAIVLVAPEELTTIRKRETGSLTLREITQKCENDVDILILEGFASLVENERAVPKIVAVKTAQEAIDASARFSPILAFTGPIPPPSRLGSLYVNVLTDPERIAAIVSRHLSKVG